MSSPPVDEADAPNQAGLARRLAQRLPFFYGWVVVACTFVILCVAYGIQFSFGVFMPEISKDTGWGRDALSLVE